MNIGRDMDGCGWLWLYWGLVGMLAGGGPRGGGRRQHVSDCLAVVVAQRVAVATWQCVGWTGNELGIFLRGDKLIIGAVLTEIWSLRLNLP
jgi:hypothetical protein